MTITINYVVKLNKQHKLECAYVDHSRGLMFIRWLLNILSVCPSVRPPLEQNKLIHIGQVLLFVPCAEVCRYLVWQTSRAAVDACPLSHM